MFILHVLAAYIFLVCNSDADDYKYVEKYYDQKVDHFNFLSDGNQTFKQRYLYNDTWWDIGKGPVLFYAGNEADIVGLWEKTGFMFKVAETFNALVVFAEHRYYGKSLPYGRDSLRGQKLRLLTVEQALADYAFFIKSFKKMFEAEDCPVIVFGGSYGGNLAAYMRFKYPNIVAGAIASSAPIYQLAGLVDGGAFFQSVTKVFRGISTSCETNVQKAFCQLQKWADSGRPGLSEASQTFHLCKPLKTQADYQHLLRWIRNAFVLAAMMNYPYPATSDYLAFPVKVMCEHLLSAPKPTDGLYSAVNLHYNRSLVKKCFDIYEEYIYCADPTGCGSGPVSMAWDYQACTQINLEGGTNGVDDMFPVLPFNSSMRDQYCFEKYKVLPRRDFLDVVFWGKEIASSSNIVFSNGNLDPWTAGGVLHNISDTLVSVMVDGGSHHLDLRGDNPNDPPSVRHVRQFEIENIRKWLDEYYGST